MDYERKIFWPSPIFHSFLLLQGVTAIAFTNDSTRLLTGGGEGLVRVWKLGRDTQTLVTGMKEHKASLCGIYV